MRSPTQRSTKRIEPAIPAAGRTRTSGFAPVLVPVFVGAFSICLSFSTIPVCVAAPQAVDASAFSNPDDIRAISRTLAPVPGNTELNGLRGMPDRDDVTDQSQSILDTTPSAMPAYDIPSTVTSSPNPQGAFQGPAPIANPRPATTAPGDGSDTGGTFAFPARPPASMPAASAPQIDSETLPTVRSGTSINVGGTGMPAPPVFSGSGTPPGMSQPQTGSPSLPSSRAGQSGIPAPVSNNSDSQIQPAAWQSPAGQRPAFGGGAPQRTPGVNQAGSGYPSGSVNPGGPVGGFPQDRSTRPQNPVAPRGATQQTGAPRSNSGTSAAPKLDLKGARALLETFSIDAQRDPLPGKPIQLVDLIGRTPVHQRQSMINQYWETWYDWANYRSAVEHRKMLAQIQAPADQASKVLLNAARSHADNDILSDEIQLVKSQSKLQEYLTPGLPAQAGSILPLPSDQPLISRYETHYQWYSSRGMLPQRLRGFDVVLPKALQLVSNRAGTVKTAQSALRQATSSRGGVGAVLDAAGFWKEAQESLISSVVSYNRAITDYSLAITPQASSPRQIASMFVSPPKANIPVATAAQAAQADQLRQNRGQRGTQLTSQTQSPSYGQAGTNQQQQAYQPRSGGQPGYAQQTQTDPRYSSNGTRGAGGGLPVRGQGLPSDRNRRGNGSNPMQQPPAAAPQDLTTRRDAPAREGFGGGVRSARNPLAPAPAGQSPPQSRTQTPPAGAGGLPTAPGGGGFRVNPSGIPPATRPDPAAGSTGGGALPPITGGTFGSAGG